MRISLIVTFCFVCLSAFAQYDPNFKFQEPRAPFNLGIGSGLSYGGFVGGRICGFPVKPVGAFVAAGFNLLKLGYNVGLIGRVMPDKRVCPILTAMYGYNAVIIVQGASQYNKVYYGPSFGGGIELHVGHKQNYMQFELVFPVRSQEYERDINSLINNPAVDISRGLPFVPSFGYHFKLD